MVVVFAFPRQSPPLSLTLLAKPSHAAEMGTINSGFKRVLTISQEVKAGILFYINDVKSPPLRSYIILTWFLHQRVKRIYDIEYLYICQIDPSAANNNRVVRAAIYQSLAIRYTLVSFYHPIDVFRKGSASTPDRRMKALDFKTPTARTEFISFNPLSSNLWSMFLFLSPPVPLPPN